jgi:RNA polymerase I-specific transcription initiation factor RRN7
VLNHCSGKLSLLTVPAAEQIRTSFQSSSQPQVISKAKQPTEEDREELIIKQHAIVNDSMKRADPGSGQQKTPKEAERSTSAGSGCPIWKTEEDLPDVAKVFYSQAAGCAAIPLKTLIVATDQLERRLEVWNIRRRKERKSGLRDVAMAE